MPMFYKDQATLDDCIRDHGIIAGIIIESKDEKPKFYAVFKKGNKAYGWKHIEFNDSNGVKHCGS